MGVAAEWHIAMVPRTLMVAPNGCADKWVPRARANVRFSCPRRRRRPWQLPFPAYEVEKATVSREASGLTEGSEWFDHYRPRTYRPSPVPRCSRPALSPTREVSKYELPCASRSRHWPDTVTPRIVDEAKLSCHGRGRRQ